MKTTFPQGRWFDEYDDDDGDDKDDDQDEGEDVDEDDAQGEGEGEGDPPLLQGSLSWTCNRPPSHRTLLMNSSGDDYQPLDFNDGHFFITMGW